MSETAGFGWLPPGVAMRQAAEERAEARQAKADEDARLLAAEAWHGRALALYRQQAEQRGEIVSAMAVARGEAIGRGLGDILGDAQAAAEREDARQASRDRREEVCYIDREPVIRPASRSAWPSSEYELARQLEQASDMHRWGVAYLARHEARRGRYAGHESAVRSAPL